MTAGLNVPRNKQNVFDYWQSADWPVKVASAQRGQQMQAVIGGLINVRGFITSEKFVRCRTPDGMSYTGGRYPPGLGANQWELTDDLLAAVVAFVPPGQQF